MSKALKLLQEHVASQQAFHKAMTESALDPGARSAHTSALESCDKTLEMCKAVQDDLERAADNQKAEVAAMVKAEVADQMLRFLGDQVVRNPGISKLATPAPTSHAVPRFGAPAPAAVEIPLEFEKMLGRKAEFQDEV